ncbi:uncharacterized protein K444DRAFT_623038 [Hyaloscypha bicolor E]|uniref:Uncharacterized protein n=1 Tax=Hyaloscypha bicolor E TaxID=1095630 RepID=A0A2J6SFE4_9HELO|nr:uncharacterized protein K444DRAFT_623038 [Hyaloscypha bicolor E]PMD49492.1 hypothetical protein K444DRAFT_623038 [Hyaloscypha bicolor E]
MTSPLAAAPRKPSSFFLSLLFTPRTPDQSANFSPSPSFLPFILSPTPQLPPPHSPFTFSLPASS